MTHQTIIVERGDHVATITLNRTAPHHRGPRGRGPRVRGEAQAAMDGPLNRGTLIPRATVVRIGGAGHMLPDEQPEAFVAAVQRFLG
jgi:pimeloyl-ACP methyl ester carboxylesterase